MREGREKKTKDGERGRSRDCIMEGDGTSSFIKMSACQSQRVVLFFVIFDAQISFHRAVVDWQRL